MASERLRERKPFKLDVSREWCETMAKLEAKHERVQTVRANIKARIEAALPEDDEGDDFNPWVWEIIESELAEALAAERQQQRAELRCGVEQLKVEAFYEEHRAAYDNVLALFAALPGAREDNDGE